MADIGQNHKEAELSSRPAGDRHDAPPASAPAPVRSDAPFYDSRPHPLDTELLLAAIEQSSDVIYITDTRGVIQYANPALETTTGYRQDEVVGHNPRLFKSGRQDAAYYRGMWKTLGEGKTWRGRFINRRKDGSLFTVEASISPIRDPSGHVINYVSVNHDITRELNELEEKVRLEIQLTQVQKLESIGRLAGGVAHDFNNTLQIILGQAEAILDQPTRNNFIRDSVQEIQRAALRSAGLTRQLLAFARQQTVSPRVCDLNEMVESSITMLRSLIGEDIDLIWQPAREPARVRIDPSQIDQILANLTINARDAISGNGHLVIALSHREVDEASAQTFTEAAPGLYVVLNVEDNGSGMSEDVLGRIFDPFFTTKEEGRGTGLGLSTVYGIVKQNGGFISVNSAPGKGTTFQIFLPLASRGEEAEETPPPASAPIGTGTVLVVEDERAIAFAVCRFLELAGYRVLTAEKPADALQLAQEHAGSVDLLLADVVMPGMSGRDLAFEMASLYPGMKFLFMSGYTSDIISHHGIIDQSLAFLAKPFTQTELLEKVRETLARS